jgi:phosphoglycerol transferase MdoB-like AlkP superfamily enzyme
MNSNLSDGWGRYQGLLVVAGLVLTISLLTRLGLVWFEGEAANFGIARLSGILAVGLIYDLSALAWLLIPFSLLALLCSRGRWGRSIHAVLSSALLAILVSTLCFTAVAEFVFWNEFASRFNFVAVDYLVYTREVVGNIQQSYPAEKILLGVALVSLLVYLSVARPFWRLAVSQAPALRVRLLVWIGLSLIPVLVFFGVDERPQKDMDPSVRELSSNGIYAFFRAYRNNELDYETYYRTLPVQEVNAVLNGELQKAGAASRPLDGSRESPMHRRIQPAGPPVRKNLVLVSIESLGSDYVDSFGGDREVTPNLDVLTEQSLTFHNLYATGLRTVRGLEAITLSVPPTPGRAVPMRERNRGLQTLGGVLKEQGYEPLYIYGGYSIFDNMRDFFGGNGYTVIDRTHISDEEITHETIWGVADEDLYHLALRELDERATRGQLFFAHIMTTSNHRPYTYPDNRVSIPSHTGRRGAVQYTDWAIGDFLSEARKRPWFADTVFVFIADHTSHGRGRIDLPPEHYLIPMWIYAPGFVAPGRVDALASQIDVAPTLLSLLNIAYDSRFFGQDILREAENHPRAFMANYLTVGYMERGLIVELGPRRYVRVVDAETGEQVSLEEPLARELVREAVSHYQESSSYLSLHAHGEDDLDGLQMATGAAASERISMDNRAR